MKTDAATFSKCERLSRKRHIDVLFKEGKSFVSFPIRIIYLPVEKAIATAPVSVLVSVPKKKIRHAVARNFIKRRIRESYRQRKQALYHSVAATNNALLVTFLYLAGEKTTFGCIDRAMENALHLLEEALNEQT
jgi:ribonuclease P protein component